MRRWSPGTRLPRAASLAPAGPAQQPCCDQERRRRSRSDLVDGFVAAAGSDLPRGLECVSEEPGMTARMYVRLADEVHVRTRWLIER